MCADHYEIDSNFYTSYEPSQLMSLHLSGEGVFVVNINVYNMIGDTT